MVKLWEYIKAEFAVLRGAPFTFVGLLVVSVGAGVAIGAWHYSERLETQELEIHRYRVALGIDKASEGALVELNNQELALRAQKIVADLRTLSTELDQKCSDIDKRAKSGELETSKAGEAKFAAMKEISQNFDGDLASDTYNVEHELRKRLSPEAIAHVVRVPAFIEGNDPNSRVTLFDFMRGSGFDAMMLGRLADEIEQMAKLLPSDSRKS